jgi:hypothetical protein
MADKPLPEERTEPPKNVQQLAEEQAAKLERDFEREENLERRKRIIILAILAFLSLCTGKKPEDQKESSDLKAPEDPNGASVEPGDSHVKALEAARQATERSR